MLATTMTGSSSLSTQRPDMAALHHPWLQQLRSHYPQGCLLSELVQVQVDLYIVRALVQVEGLTIATAHAAATTVEVAEDRARSRVLDAIGANHQPLPLPTLTGATGPAVGLASLSNHHDSHNSQHEPELEAEPTVETPRSTSATRSKAARTKAKAMPTPEVHPSDLSMPAASLTESLSAEPTSLLESVAESVAIAPEPTPVEPDVEILGGSDLVEEVIEYEYTFEAEDLPEGAVTPAAQPSSGAIGKPAVNSSAVNAVVPASFSSEPALDLSDAIAQISTEMDRIGWTKKQGSAYLQETYSKRTRAELTSQELLGFLNYLKSLPAKVQPALHQIPF
ncbi:MAG: hypothetical protein VKJ24_05800 [Synechococcales bacterium]|nr:hypothetical protein [Synechococcales bacterium]